MDRNKLIKLGQMTQNKSNLTLPALAIKSDPSAKDSLRKAKAQPSITNIWNNSIYSFNSNFLKNLPAVDNIVNKLIKSFFTINPLANNPKGKKSKLVQRRYFRLSLNKILVSKSEIKHDNDKVFITVYLFNKKKKSLLLGLKKLYNSFIGESINKSNKEFNKLTLNNTSNLKISNKNTSFNQTMLRRNKTLHKNTNNSLNNLLVNKYAVAGLLNNNKSKQSNINNVISNNEYYEYFQKNFTNFIKYANKKRYQIYNNRFALKYKILTGLNTGLAFKRTAQVQAGKALNNASLYLKEKGATKNLLPIKTKKTMLLNKNSSINSASLAKTLPLYYYKLNNITRFNMYKFFASLTNNNNNINIKNIYNLLNNSKLNSKIESSTLKELLQLFDKENLKYFSRYVNKYKLYYNLYNNTKQPILLSQKDKVFNITTLTQKPNHSIFKLRSIYKLFAINNNIHLETNYTNTSSNENTNYISKLLLNNYKTLKKSNVKKSFINTNNLAKNQILVNKLNKIDKFFDKYNDTLSNTLQNNNITNSLINMRLAFKLNFINEILEKELLYIHYLKLLSYNQAIFQNWFTYPLRNLISKIYNKKVVLNLVNLKYIHLNSDILTQAVDIKLRNFKRNRVVKVLKKIIKLVPISKINIYACDEHSSIYKYVKDHHKRFSTLKFDIFKDLLTNPINSSTTESNKDNFNYENKGSYIPCKIRRLNHEQASTINFIKYKTVFGVRFEAAGRLTKRSTASRSLFKFKYKGSLRNNPSVILNNSDTAIRIKNNRISNLQFTKIASKTRNGSFGLKGWINNN